ncbi:patatin-like phospholipase family protein [Burkholderia gladioli]|uniref:patatin-like phospholipase family protein n=1 Tax=Burkholderia gladioli TaxID=28095 RepID=UPI00163DF6CE|nr:patatin-like phospholipase family protein [Burkholderia gladioli]
MTIEQDEPANPQHERSNPSAAARSIFLAFQGGGARGIAHVGGLSAVNALGLNIEGVAGTSAGAIMAALVAAHYRADDLLNPIARTHLLHVVAGGRFKKATELFTVKGWKAISCLRTVAAARHRLAERLARYGISPILMALWRRPWGKSAVFGAAALLVIAVDALIPRAAFLLLLTTVGMAAWVVLRCLSGLASLEEVRVLVDEAIAEGLKISTRDITFEQLQEHGGLPLKLVATNVSTQSLELFSVETTPTATVADAVAASICLPVAFKAWSFRFRRRGDAEPVKRYFIDGGLVSNLPVWTFDEERALQPDAVTVAFGLAPKEASSGPPHWLPAALHTVVAGPPEVHFRGIERLIHVPLSSTLDVLDFDASFDDLAEEVVRAKREAQAHLERNLTEVPSAIRQTLQDMQRALSEELRLSFPDEFGGGRLASPLVRIALAIQKPSQRISLSLAYEVGHVDSIRGSRFSLTTSPIGASWTENQTGFYIFGAGHDQARIYGDSAWAGFFPIKDREEEGADQFPGELAVVAIVDSSSSLPDTIFTDEVRLEEFWVTLSDAAYDFFDENDVGRLFRRSIAWL